MSWILGAGGAARWHVAVVKPSAYEPGHTITAAACSGRQVGGAFGPLTFHGPGAPSEIEHAHCARCAAIAAGKAKPAR